MGEATKDALKTLGATLNDIDHFLYHQANSKILSSLCRQFSIPSERAHRNIDHVGNTSSSSVPLLLAEGLAAREIHPGQTVLMGAFGAGYSYGVAIYKVPADEA